MRAPLDRAREPALALRRGIGGNDEDHAASHRYRGHPFNPPIGGGSPSCARPIACWSFSKPIRALSAKGWSSPSTAAASTFSTRWCAVSSRWSLASTRAWAAASVSRLGRAQFPRQGRLCHRARRHRRGAVGPARQGGRPERARLIGACRTAVPVYHSGGLWLTASSTSCSARPAPSSQQGFRAMKMRLGMPDAARGRARVRAVREAIGPDIALMVDANQQLTCRRRSASAACWRSST